MDDLPQVSMSPRPPRQLFDYHAFLMLVVAVTLICGMRMHCPAADSAAKVQSTKVEIAKPTKEELSLPPVFREGTEVLLIDLPTALRLANANNPSIALARQRVEEAYARVDQSDTLWLPDLIVGPAYQRHDGQIQNAAGLVFPTSKSNLYAGGGAVLRVETSDALFAPLIERRLARAAEAASQSTTQNVQLDVALAYLDLLQVYGQISVNADILARARELLRLTDVAEKAQAIKTPVDVPRAKTEVSIRLQERTALYGQARIASARLARLLLLRPTIGLTPADTAVVPVTLVNEECSLDDLVMQGLMNRPELAENRASAAAYMIRLRQARLGPLLPRVEVSYTTGVFGGGLNDFVGTFAGRGDGSAQVIWELHGLGFGDRARVRERQAQLSQANLHLTETQSRVAEEVTSAAQLARARSESLSSGQEAVRQAAEMWTRLYKTSLELLGPRKELASLDALLAVQTLAQARTLYLNEVIEYNKSQFQLFTAMGQPPLVALPKATSISVDVPPVPETWKPSRP